MKKLIVIGIAVLLVMGISALSYADERSTNKIIPVQLQVGVDFGFEVWDSQLLTQVLKPNGGIVPDPTPEDPDRVRDERLGGINMIVTTNKGTAWYITASSDGCMDPAYPTNLVPLIISTYAGANTLLGDTVEDLELISSAQNIYTADSTDETSVRGFEVVATFLAKPDHPMAQGTYDGEIRLTMAD